MSMAPSMPAPETMKRLAGLNGIETPRGQACFGPKKSDSPESPNQYAQQDRKALRLPNGGQQRPDLSAG
jgi:hypothetical protein